MDKDLKPIYGAGGGLGGNFIEEIKLWYVNLYTSFYFNEILKFVHFMNSCLKIYQNT